MFESNTQPDAQRLADILVQCVVWGDFEWLNTKLSPSLFEHFDVDRLSTKGISALHAAVSEEDYEMVRYLVEDMRADVNCLTNQGDSPLLIAAGLGDAEMVEYLVGQKAMIDLPNNRDRTPFSVAAEMGKYEIASTLSEYRCNYDFVDAGGKNALYYACRHGHLPIVQLLIGELRCHYDRTSVRSHLQPPMVGASLGGHLSVVRYLVNEGADVNAQDTSGFTPLIIASINGHLDIVKYLVVEGHALVNKADDQGLTAHKHALSTNNQDVADFFLRSLPTSTAKPQCDDVGGGLQAQGPPTRKKKCKFGFRCQRGDCYYQHPTVCKCGVRSTSWKNLRQHINGRKCPVFGKGNPPYQPPNHSFARSDDGSTRFDDGSTRFDSPARFNDGSVRFDDNNAKHKPPLPRLPNGDLDLSRIKDYHGNSPSTTLWVGFKDHPVRPNEQNIKSLFSKHFEVVGTDFMGDRGYAFVHSRGVPGVVMARHALNGETIMGGTFIVNFVPSSQRNPNDDLNYYSRSDTCKVVVETGTGGVGGESATKSIEEAKVQKAQVQKKIDDVKATKDPSQEEVEASSTLEDMEVADEKGDGGTEREYV